MQVPNIQVNPRSAEFRANAEAMRTLVKDLRAKASEVEQGCGPAARDKHTSGKLVVDRAFRFAPGDQVRDGAEMVNFEGVE